MKLLLSLLLSCSVVRAADSGGPAPATVTKEGDLVVLRLKPEAEQRLRLKTVAVEKRRVPSTRLFSGDVVQSLATEGRVVAPVIGGTIDEVLRIADQQAAADGRILQAKAQLESAALALGRAQKLFSASADSVRSLDDAKTAMALAEAALVTAKAQRELLGAPVGGSDAKRVWVRVAIYSGEAALLDARAPASVRALAAGEPLSVEPAQGPATANTATNTVDWYYTLPDGSVLRPGERVAAEIATLEGREERAVVPFSAVVHDIHGGQWVYEQTAEHTFTRRRVQVARLAGSDAVLAAGPPSGTRVVTDGAAELFGTEFVTGK
jgi:hypothetical protein